MVPVFELATEASATTDVPPILKQPDFLPMRIAAMVLSGYELQLATKPVARSVLPPVARSVLPPAMSVEAVRAKSAGVTLLLSFRQPIASSAAAAPTKAKFLDITFPP